MGYFYPPPPSFVGGRQPYAPALGIAQSGPVPQAPPLRGAIALATFGVIFASWQPPFVQAQGAADIAPFLPVAVASQPPTLNRTIQTVIQSSWQSDPTTVVPLCSVAAFAQAPVISQPPPLSGVNLQSILQTWQPLTSLIQGAADIAPMLSAPVISQPPVPSGMSLRIIRSGWDAPVYLAQGAGDIAPSLPIISQPQPVSLAQLYTIRATWETPWTVAYFQGAGDIAPNIPVSAGASAPPVPSSVNFETVLQAWQPPFFLAQGAGDIAPSLPAAAVASQPPIPSAVNFETILQSWLPGFILPQRQQGVATQPIVNAPPPTNGAQFASLIALNQPLPYALPPATDMAPMLPAPTAPSQPPPIGSATLNLIVRGWDAPVWWPLADNGQSVPLATTFGSPPAPNLAQLYALVAASQPAFILPPTGEDFAPLISAPVVSSPPAVSLATLRLALQSWDVISQPLQPRAVVTASGPIPQPPPPMSRVTLQTIVQLNQPPWTYGQGFGTIAVYPVLGPITGGPRYITSRLRKRRFSVSAVTYSQFEPKAPDESVKLTFDFSVDLDTGITLSGTPSVTITASGDSNPSAIQNGLARFDVTSTQVIVPVKDGLDGTQYKIHVQTPTTDPLTVLSLSGVLPVIA